MIADIVFIFVAGSAIVFALIAISRQRPFDAVLWGFPCLLSMAVLSALLGAPLIAALQMVAAVASATLLGLFALMVTDPTEQRMRPRYLRFGKVLGAVAALYFIIVMVVVVAAPPFQGAPHSGEYYESPVNVGHFLIARSAATFVLASVLLFVATIAIMLIASDRKKPEADTEWETIA